MNPLYPRWTVIHNARIRTLDPQMPRASSILLVDGRIVAVAAEDLRDSIGSLGAVRAIDAGGRTIVPAFTDSHIHFVEWGLALARPDVDAARSPEDVARIARRHVDQHPVPPGRWIVGQGWSHNNWTSPELPTSPRLLDELFPDNPVVLYSKCLHLAWVNSAALRIGGVDRNTPDPAGGEIARNTATGEPTGILKENAEDLVQKYIPACTELDRQEAIQRATRACHAHGIVAVHPLESADTFASFQRAHDASRLRMRVAFYHPVAVLDELLRAGIRMGLGDDRLKTLGVKLFTDGSLGGRTAWMIDPYEGEPENRGIPVMEIDVLQDRVARANAGGLSCAIHAIGDRAIRETLIAYQKSWAALADRPERQRLRNRIEHFQTFHPDDLPRLADLPVYATMQPVHLFADWRPADRFLGSKRAALTYACDTLRKAGARIALGSDAPVEHVNVAWGLHATCHRMDLDNKPVYGWHSHEALTVEQALEGYCVVPAEIAGEEHQRGRLRPGMVADLAVLDRDPVEAPRGTLKDMKVLGTMLDGRWVHLDESVREQLRPDEAETLDEIPTLAAAAGAHP